MSRIKRLLTYVIAIIAFMFFSEFLINMNLRSSYYNLERQDNISQVLIKQAKATKQGGEITGKIINPEENKLNGKYLKIDFYSDSNVLMGTKYIDISKLQTNKMQDLNLTYKIENTKYYSISVVDEMSTK